MTDDDLLRRIEERRADPEFRARLDRHMEENREALDLLADGDSIISDHMRTRLARVLNDPQTLEAIAGDLANARTPMGIDLGFLLADKIARESRADVQRVLDALAQVFQGAGLLNGKDET